MDFPSDFEDPLKSCKEECIFCPRLERCPYIYDVNICPLDEERNEFVKEID